MDSPSRPPRLPGRYGLPGTASLSGLELSLPLSRGQSSRSNSSIASSINKPLPPSPRLKTPPVPSLRASSSFSIRTQEDIIQSYADREPAPSISSSGWSSSMPSLRDELLPPRVFAKSPAKKSSLSVLVPQVRRPTGNFSANNLYTSSDTMLPLRRAEGSSLVPPSRLRQTHPYSAPSPLEAPRQMVNELSFDDSDNSVASKYTSTASSPISSSHSPDSSRFAVPQVAVYDMANNTGGPYAVSPLTLSPRSPTWRMSTGSELSPPSEKPSETDQSSYLASLYRNTLPPGPHRLPPSTPSLSESVAPPPLRYSQGPAVVELARESEESRPVSRFSDSPNTPTGNGPTFTTLRSLARKALHRHKASLEEEKERQKVIETAELKYPAMTSPTSTKRISLPSPRRSSVQAKFGDMYDTLATLTPLKSRTPSVQTTFPSTYAWTPISTTNPTPFAWEPSPAQTVHEEATHRTGSPRQTRQKTPPLRPPRGARPKQIAVPLTPYQMYGSKAWKMEAEKKKNAKKRKKDDFRPNSLRLSSHREFKDHQGRPRANTRDIGDEHRKTPQTLWTPGALPTSRSEPMSRLSRLGRAATPKTPKTPKTSRLHMPRLWGTGEQEQDSWLGRRKAKKEEERTEKWKNDVKARIVVVGGSQVGGADMGSHMQGAEAPRGLGDEAWQNQQEGWI